jgi:hypothetical protein
MQIVRRHILVFKQVARKRTRVLFIGYTQEEALARFLV